MKDEYKKGVEMINKLGDSYLYVREIEDEAFDEGARMGLLVGFGTGVIITLLFISVILYTTTPTYKQ